MKIQIKFFKKFIFGAIFIFYFSFLFGENFVFANKETNLIFVVQIESEIKAGTFEYLKRAIKLAEKEKADYFLIKLETPGGLLKPTKDITDLILTTPLKTIVFVHKEGGWAYSAGTFILLAADLAVVHPEASIGAAQPRELNVGELKETDQKIVEGIASWIKSLASANQKNSEIAEKFVRENLTLTGKEAKELGIINETAKDLNELFLKLNISEPKIREISPTFIEKIFDFLSHPYLVSFLLGVGGLTLFMAIRSGEFELTGILGIISLLIGLWGIGIITFSLMGIFLLIVGILLLIFEFFEPGIGIFGIGGIVSLLLGILTFEAEPFLRNTFFETITILVFTTTLVFGVVFIIIGKKVIKTLKTKPETGPESLIGLKCEVVEELKPRGRVRIKEEFWLAESLDGKTIPKNSKVEIIKVEGNTLYVKKC